MPSRRLPPLAVLAALAGVLGAFQSACSDSDAAPPQTVAGSSAGGSAASHAAAGSSSAAGSSGGSSSAGNSMSGNSSAGGSSSGSSSAGGVADAGAANAGQPNLPPDGHWQPRAGLTWQWQLSENVNDPLDVDVYDIDWEADRATVDALHAAGIKVICYVSVGSWEDFRPDADDFPASVIGNDYDGWPGEKYVDIRSPDLRSVMSARFDVCKAKGFDAIEPDNQDVFELGDESGFPLTRSDGIEYAHWLADAAHSRGLGIGQKNAASITAELVDSYDWALTESCYSDGDWCGDVQAYVSADKPVFMCEYEAASFSDACAAWKPKSFSPILKNLDLDAPVTACP